jgi:hypothetical protein
MSTYNESRGSEQQTGAWTNMCRLQAGPSLAGTPLYSPQCSSRPLACKIGAARSHFSACINRGSKAERRRQGRRLAGRAGLEGARDGLAASARGVLRRCRTPQLLVCCLPHDAHHAAALLAHVRRALSLRRQPCHVIGAAGRRGRPGPCTVIHIHAGGAAAAAHILVEALLPLLPTTLRCH